MLHSTDGGTRVQCSKCSTWRILPLTFDADSLPVIWTCPDIGKVCGEGNALDGSIESAGPSIPPRKIEVEINATRLLALSEEFQCAICFESMYKPVAVSCGHAFCRACLLGVINLDNLSTISCPVCRTDICDCVRTMSINIPLWNVLQILYPSVYEERQNSEEELYISRKREFDSAWECFNRQRELISADDVSSEQAPEVRRTEEFHQCPYVQIDEDTIQDGNLLVKRNIVVDESSNVDGNRTMRLAFGLIEFPSIVEPYTEHQEVSMAILQMEEDETELEGFPIFIDENGNHDDFVFGSYYDEVSLIIRSTNNGEEVLRRTRCAQAGVVDFPNLRIDARCGDYEFTFEDKSRNLHLSVITSIRESHLTESLPTALESYQRRGVLDESFYPRDNTISADEHYYPESEDSFIVESDDNNISNESEDSEEDIIQSNQKRKYQQDSPASDKPNKMPKGRKSIVDSSDSDTDEYDCYETSIEPKGEGNSINVEESDMLDKSREGDVSQSVSIKDEPKEDISMAIIDSSDSKEVKDDTDSLKGMKDKVNFVKLKESEILEKAQKGDVCQSVSVRDDHEEDRDKA